MKMFFDWLDHRTGWRNVAGAALAEPIPGGSRWRYVWGSTLVFTFFIQVITGLFLWLGYSPSATSAWESVYYLQYETAGGWLLRGIHHFTASLMVLLVVVHLLQVVVDGAYRAPREVNFWLGLALLHLVLALALTGYLLPWDQKGFWATKVATNLMGIVPVLGPAMQQLLIGGSDYGHLTLTRFFALHAGILPAAVVLLVVGHVYLFRRHGINAKKPLRRPDQQFWPDQVLKDAIACAVVLGAVLLLVLRPWQTSAPGELGAELGAPADPAEPYSAARPEWYFLFLFQFLKYFPGESEIWGAAVIPTLVMGVIFLMPFWGKFRVGHAFNVAFLALLIVGAGWLTWQAWAQDGKDPGYIAAQAEADRAAARLKTLVRVREGVPSDGAAALLRSDAFLQGPKLFARHCANCHRYDGHNGLGQLPPEPPTAADLKGFGSRAWLAGLLDPQHISTTNYFGATKFKDGKMVRFVKRDVAKFDAGQKAQLHKVIFALSAEAGLRAQASEDRRDQADIVAGRALIDTEEMRCTECHAFHKHNEEATAPELTGYASRQWLIDFINQPGHPRFYGSRNDRMPAFGTDKILDPASIGLIADWLRGDWTEAGQGVAAR